ncbi:hypothetical protein HY642_05755 [Candidatus Woesearchaeota archaeon]|nr:hypothetical protein [Candidatus Woesearchaeota archaeon]
MTDTTISVRVDQSLYNQMKLHDEYNWSALIRKSIADQISKMEEIDVPRAKRAAESIDLMRKKGLFDQGKPAVEIIREWRNKRR